MRKLSLLLLLLAAVMLPVCAQQKGKDRDEMRKEIEEYKMKFLAQEMELKEDQQKKFFELYAQMSSERRKIFKEIKTLEKKIANSRNATDAEYKEVTDAINAAKDKDSAVVKKYDEKFSQFLSQKQIYKMKAAEEQFRKRMNEMRHGGRNSKK